MSEPRFTPARSDAIRDELIHVVEAATRPTGFRRLLAGAGLVVAGVLVGAGGFAATADIWKPQPYMPEAVPVVEPTSNPGVLAPTGHSPGQPIVSLVGQANTYEVNGEERIIQLDPPEGATHVRVGVTCTTPGTTGWGFDPGGNNPSMSCSAADVEANSGAGWMDFDLHDDSMYPQHELVYVQPEPGAGSIVTVQYLALVETAWAVNAHGETCGVGKPGFGEPDLVLVVARTAGGEYVDGYVRRAQLEYPYPGEQMPTSPAQALEQQEEHAELYPNGIDVPAYECDGETQVGTFHIG
jgi:hypothetical protein